MRLVIHVRPGASKPNVGPLHGDALVVAVTQRAVDGRATAAALQAVADALGLPARSVRLVQGATSRRKVVELDVDEGDAAAVTARLEALGRVARRR